MADINMRETVVIICASDREGLVCAANLVGARPNIFISVAPDLGDWEWLPRGDALLRFAGAGDEQCVRAGLLYAPGFVVAFCRGSAPPLEQNLCAVLDSARTAGIAVGEACWAVSKEYAASNGIPAWQERDSGLTKRDAHGWLRDLIPLDRVLINLGEGGEWVTEAVRAAGATEVADKPRCIVSGPDPTSRKLELFRRAVPTNGRVVVWYSNEPEPGHSYTMRFGDGKVLAVYSPLR